MTDWKGIFEWSMKYNDGTSDAKPVSEEDRKWFMEAMEHLKENEPAQQMKRMVELLQGPDLDGAAGEEQLLAREDALEALLDLVENLDHARDLKCIGGLPSLIRFLESPHEGLRWRAAEVVGACVQNFETVQRWFLEGGVLPPLMSILSGNSLLCRTKALFALSGLMQNFPPAQAAFRGAGGLQHLVNSLDAPRVQLQRKALQALRMLTGASAADRTGAVGLGAVGKAAGMVGHEDLGLREAALAVLTELLADPGALSEAQDLKLEEKVAGHMAELGALKGEDRAAAEDELHLCEALLSGLRSS